jgi:hypothetical protein
MQRLKVVPLFFNIFLIFLIKYLYKNILENNLKKIKKIFTKRLNCDIFWIKVGENGEKEHIFPLILKETGR